MAEYKNNGILYKTNENYKTANEFISITKIDTPPPNNELYHYYSLSDNGVNSFLANYIYANHPYHFNDPYDCYSALISFERCSLDEILELNDGIFKEEILANLYKSSEEKDKIKLAKHLNYLLYNVIYLKTGIFCMTDNIESIPMWSYYNNHQGFALKYDTNLFPKTFWGPFPINYAESFEPIDYRIFKRASFIYQANVKAKCWESENEYRLIFFGPETMKIPQMDTPNAHNRKFYHNPKAIIKVVLGFNFFSIREYDIENSNENKAVITLKERTKLKRKILNHIANNQIPTSMIKIKDKGYGLKAYSVDIETISTNKYILIFS